MYGKAVAASLLLGISSLASADPAIWLAGDSTVATYPANRAPMAGWGQMLGEFCRPEVKVNNRAVGGRSTKSFIDEKRWDKILKGLKPGDFVFIQFGHNDQKKEKPEVFADADSSYQELLKKYISETREKGATPILVTSMYRRIFKDNKLSDTLGKYPEAMKKVAAETKTALIDLHSISALEFAKAGAEGTKKIFLHAAPGELPNYPKGITDNSHFSENGARMIAGWIVEDAKKQQLDVAKLFK